MNKIFEISVVMVTYNQEHYIKQAIESVLNQKTTFEFHIFIGDDFSKDNTRNILLDYKRKYPDKITLLLNEKNVGVHENVLETFRAANSKYVAFLEGDDFYSKDSHLQMLFEAFEQNQPIGFVASTYSHIDKKNNIKYYPSTKKLYSILDVFTNRPFHISSSLYKNEDIKDLIKFAESKNNCNYFLDKNIFIACAKNRNILVLENNSMMYRYQQGITSNKNIDIQLTIQKIGLHLDLIEYYKINIVLKSFIETNLLLIKTKNISLEKKIITIIKIILSKRFLIYPEKMNLVKKIIKLF